jgi:hypothetical protein
MSRYDVTTEYVQHVYHNAFFGLKTKQVNPEYKEAEYGNMCKTIEA